MARQRLHAAREMAHVAGLENAAALDALAGDPVAVDLSAEGPWMTAQSNSFQQQCAHELCAWAVFREAKSESVRQSGF